MSAGVRPRSRAEHNEGPKQWHADLSGMSMAREVKVDVRSRCLVVHIGGMSEKKPEGPGGHHRHRACQIGAIIIVRIVHTNYPQPAIRSTHADGFIDQHPYAGLFQLDRNFGAIVIPKDPDDAMAGSDSAQNVAHARINCVARSIHLISIVAGQNAEVDGQ